MPDSAPVAEPLKIAVIGGSGLGETFDAQNAVSHSVGTPFGPPSAPILETTFDGVPVLLLKRHGEGHTLNPTQVPYRANLFALKQLGATHVLASGAVGSLREEHAPRDLLIPDSTIDRTKHRPSTFYDRAAVHVEFADPFCPILRQMVIQVSTKGEMGARTHPKGTYVCMEGPAFSTRAESLEHRLIGGDVIGMTLLPEAKLAKEAELPYAAICLVTDYDCWRPRPDTAGDPDPFTLLNEIIGHLKQATANASDLIRRTISHMARHPDELAKCPAKRALELAIWSDKSKLDPAEIERLKPLWGRHF